MRGVSTHLIVFKLPRIQDHKNMFLMEYQNPTSLIAESSDEYVDISGNKRKHLYMKGVFVQGNVKNANQRVYPVSEIKKAVDSINRIIKEGADVLGEADHPADLKINLDRVSHKITEMWMEGFDGMGKLQVLPTPMGNIVKALLESQVKLGVSSRGSGNVNESTGQVSDFEIITVDVVAQPSAPNAYPKPIYEGLMNFRRGSELLEIAAEARYNPKVQKFLADGIANFIRDLKV
jgi:hypothetical protein